MNQLRNTRRYSRSGRGYSSGGYPSGRGGSNQPPHRRVNGKRLATITIIVILVLALIGAGVYLLITGCGPDNTPIPTKSTKPSAGTTPSPKGSGQPTDSILPSPTATVSVVPSDFTIASTDKTDPVKQGFVTKIYTGDNTDSKVDSYTRPQPINFGDASTYTNLEGVITFRGNNYRNVSSYGTANVTQQTLTKAWEVNTGGLKDSNGKLWAGSCWTGQPLIVKWPDDTKKFMNLYDKFKTDPDFVEVIYPCMDGYIHFYDLKTKEKSRPAINIGVSFKGTASLYPNGIPMIFLGQGVQKTGSGANQQYFIYSLIDGTKLSSFGALDPVSHRTWWNAFDSSALISADTDTLIEPGESGVLYTMKLNTQYDKTTGKLSINPDKPVKATYTSQYKDQSESVAPSSHTNKWSGWEDSSIIWRNYFFCGDNAGAYMCIDLNTMKLVWVADCIDDINATAVLEESAQDQTAYIYMANSLEAANYPEKTVIRKINIKNGETVWQNDQYNSHANNPSSDTAGGVLGTPILGKGDISNLIIYPLSRYPNNNNGMLVALDKNSGKEVWHVPTGNYLWSSPVTFYTPEGKSYVVEFDTATGEKNRGNIYLIEGASGHLIKEYTFADYSPDQYSTVQGKEYYGAAIEATAAVYNDMLVIGSRGSKIYCFKIK